jgi:hypothetical protein
VAGLALATLFVFVSHEVPYLATRPPESAKFPDLSIALQRVDARLWQDPFSAVEDFEHREVARRTFDADAEKVSPAVAPHGSAQNKSGEPPFSVARFGVTPDEFKKLVAPEGNGSAKDSSLRELAVLMSSSHFVGGEEARRRTRYAVVAALDELGYAPVDGDHIGYVVVAMTDAPAGAPPVRVPFEAFEAVGMAQGGPVVDKAVTRPTRVIVLWVDESALVPPVTKGSTWLEALADVLRNLGACPPEPQRCDVPVIGPSSSDRYQALVRNLDSSENPPRSQLRWLVSPFVTSNLIDNERILSKLKQRELTVVPTIVPDRNVIHDLLGELSLRKVPLCDHSRNILLVGEWDTEYGRRAKDTFHNEFDALRCPKEGKDDRANIMTYSFVRGLDGVAMGSSSKPTADSAANPSAPFVGSASAQIEWPESPDQRDYLRRIGTQLSQLNQSRSIAAVGILASDTHDKLLLLQGLRGIFPRAVFFTTDVDARYMHPLVQQWARNLIIAGAYGLALGEDVQQRTPPFRDGYQTSTFLATSLALQLPIPVQDGDWQFLARQPVQLYEVGRTHLVPLLPDTGESTQRSACALAALQSCREKGLQPRYSLPPRGLQLRSSLLVLWLVSACAMLAWAWRRPVAGTTRGTDVGRVLSYVFLVGLIGSLILFAALLWQVAYPTTRAYPPEPLLFSEGVSSWPVALLWCFALALTFMFLARIARTVGARLDETRARFVGDATDAANQGGETWARCWEGGGAWAGCWEWLKTCLFVSRQATAHNSSTRVKFEDVWNRYQLRARGLCRVVRIGGIWVALFLLPFLLLHGPDLAPPPVIRGAFHNVVLWLDRVHFLMLTILMAGVADAAILCTCFVFDVGRGRSEYPGPVLDAFCARLGLCKELKPYLDEYIDCEVVGERTAAIAQYLYYPFIVLAVLAISMTSLFDDWVFSLARVGLYAFYIGVLLLLWLGLHWTATRARAQSLAEMERMWIELQRDGKADPKAAETMRRQFPLLVNHVRELNVGAYGPLLGQPIFRALLWPLGSLSSTQLVQYLFLR